MKWKLALVIGILALSPVAVFAAQTVVLDSSVTLVLPADGTSYILYSNSAFDSLTVNSDNFSFGLVGGSVVEITSSDKRKLTNTLGITTVCQADNSYIHLELTNSPSSTTTVTVTPSGNACTGAGGSTTSGSTGGSGTTGSSGGGGFSPVPVPVLVPAPSPTPQTQTTPGLISPISSSASLFLTQTLKSGSKGDEVKALQKYLGVKVTGLYGDLTRIAVQKFQETNKLAKKGDSGYGTVGPKTKAKLNEMLLQQGSSKPESEEQIKNEIQSIQSKIDQINKSP